MSENWRNWSFDEWNDQLFAHFFRPNELGDEPVTRLLVTYEALAEITGEASTNPDEVRDELRRVMHDQMKTTNSSIITSASKLIRDKSWSVNSVSTPPFIFHLIITCLSAADSSGELVDEGDFRKRLGNLTGWTDTQDMKGLPELWKKLAEWLAAMRQTGSHVRLLDLPDVGHEVLIGYSKKLAFPGHADQRKLVDLLEGAELLGDEPPVGSVLKLLTSQHNFSPVFRNEFEVFQKERLGSADVSRTPFWSAVRNAALRDPRAVRLRRSMSNWIVVADIDSREGDILPYIMGRGPFAQGIFDTEVGLAVGEFKHGLKASGGDDPYDTAFLQTLIGAPDAPALKRLQRAAGEGVLLFVKIQGEETLELVYRKPDAQYVVALVRHDLVEEYRDTVRQLYPKLIAHPTKYEGWTQVVLDGSDTANFASLRFSSESFANVLCLRSVSRPPRLWVVDGVRLASKEFLGIRGVLPFVTCDGATSVYLKGEGGVSLEPVDSRTWQFPVGWEPSEASSFELVAETASGPIRMDITFRNRVTNNDYRWPSESKIWRTEGNTTSAMWLQSFQQSGRILAETRGDDWIDLLTITAGLGSSFGEIRLDSKGCDWKFVHYPDAKCDYLEWIGGDVPLPRTNLAATKSGRRRWLRWLGEDLGDHTYHTFQQKYLKRARVQPAPPLDRSIPSEVPKKWSFTGPEPCEKVFQLERALAALALRKTGISEFELIDLFRRLLTASSFTLLWDLVRAWREVGALVRLSNVRWRRAVYHPVPPHLVMYPVGRRIGVTLVGLSTVSVRSRFEAMVLAQKGVMRHRVGTSPLVPIPPGAFFESTEAAFTLARKLDLPDPRWLVDFKECITSVDVVAKMEGDEPLNYPAHSIWNFKHCVFACDSADSRAGIQLVNHRRRDSPDYWAVCDDKNNTYWWSYSRNWSLLVAYWLADSFPFITEGERHLKRKVRAGVYLPIGIGNLLGVVSAVLPGPKNRGTREADGFDYIYTFPTAEFRQDTIAALGDMVLERKLTPKRSAVQQIPLIVEMKKKADPAAVQQEFLSILKWLGAPDPTSREDGLWGFEHASVAFGFDVPQAVVHENVAKGVVVLSFDTKSDLRQVAYDVMELIGEPHS